MLAGFSHALCLVRWTIFLRITGVPVRWREAAAVFWAGLFGNLFLPGGAGGDLVRIGLLAGSGRDGGRVAVSVLLDRLCGSVSMIAVGGGVILTGGVASHPHLDGLMRGIVIYLSVLGLGIVASVVLSSRQVVSRLPESWPGRARLVELTGAYFECAVQWPRTLLATAVSCVMLLAYFLVFYFASAACGLGLPVRDFLGIMPAIDIVSALPVSLGGLGVREAAFTHVLGGLGVPGAAAVAVSLTGYIVSSLWALPGAFAWIRK